jgi:hypothetical protein
VAATVAGFRYWGLVYDEHGCSVGSGEAELKDDLAGSGITDLFVIAHGWNSDSAIACQLYERFFDQVADVLGDTPVTIAVAGIGWPSMRWPDEEVRAAPLGGAAGVEERVVEWDVDNATVVDALRRIYVNSSEHAALREIQDLLDRRPADIAALERFQQLLAILAAGPDVPDAECDGGEVMLVDGPAEAVFDQAADIEPEDFAGGAAGFGDAFDRLWFGAKQALRQTSYWKMKKRAGLVGVNAVAPLIEDLGRRAGSVRIHLIGHSLGARLMSYAVRGISDAAVATGSPVKSVTLLQGAFSHFAFAPSLPHAPERRGGLVDAVRRVDGPLLATHSEFDLAVGRWYPWASILGRDDAAGIESQLYRWGAIGHDGAQHSGAIEARVQRCGDSYGFQPGRIHNLDANDVVVEGRGPAGAHGDIFHPELAWAVVDAAAVRA